MQPLMSLQLFAWVLLLFPYVMGLFTILDIDRFRRNAFGLYAKSSAALIVGTCIGLAYYTLVVAEGLTAHAIDHMSVWPLDLQGSLLYLQALFALGAVVTLWVASMRLLNIVEPRASQIEAARAIAKAAATSGQK